MTDTKLNIKSQPRDARGRVIGASPMKPILDALNAAFIVIRQRHPDVPNVVLVIGQSSKTKHGHFDPEKWHNEKATSEIMISGQSLARGAVATLGTLIHEAAHASAHAQGIQDTSRQGRFHNKKFKALGESMGLLLTNDSSIGWSITDVPKTTQVEYRAEISALNKALKAYRIPERVSAKPRTTVRLECSCRALTVPIKFHEAGDIQCELCGDTFLDLNAEDDGEE